MSKLNIAIDGPAGAGKSTVAKAVARELNIKYLDTGAMYRAMAMLVIRAGVDPKDEEGVSRILPDADVKVVYTEQGQRVLLSGEDVTDGLRTPEMSMGASAVSAHPCVRLKLTDLQRAVAKEYDVIMDGRDIGTNVLKDSPCKIFLTADAHERALRRYREMLEKGQEADLASIEKDIIERDYNDSHRAFMPLRQAEDAVLVDSTEMDIQEVTARILEIVKERYEA